MSTYILIHGAWHGGWCWAGVADRLRKEGHTVIAPDLPGHGEDRTPVSDVTLDAYTNSVAGILDRQNEPVILVGHSMGGLVISEATEARPEKVAKLVYVCAFLLRDGQTLGEIVQRDVRALVMPNLIMGEGGVSATLRKEVLHDAFYGNCSEEVSSFARSKLVPQALAPFGTPLKLTDSNFGRIPRTYVECTEDRAISIEIQREMRLVSPCATRYTLESDHSPFLSKPDELAKILSSVSKS